MAVQRTVTTPGSYQAPVEGIVDYGAFQRGLEKGIAPGLAFLAEKKKKDEEAEKTELDVGVKAFTGINKNIMTGDVDLKTNDFFEINSVEAMSRFRPQYIDAVKRGDTKTQNEILRSIGKAKQSYNNLSEYIKNIGSPDVFDGKVSNTRFLDENGQEINFNGVDFTQVNNNNPQNIRQGTKRNKQGIIKQGFYILKDGKQYFLNTQDMDQAYRDSHFEIKDNLQGDISASVRKGGTAELFTRTPQYNTNKDATVTITKEDGTQIQVNEGNSQKYIRRQFYDKAESNASIFAQNKYKTTSDPTNESAWNQLTNDSVFVSKLGGKLISAEDRKSGEYTDEEKILLLQDYAAERWKISVADQGYVTGKNGRALERNTVAYSETGTTTTRPIEEEKDGFGFGSIPGLSDASRILAQINFNQSGAPGASLNYFKDIDVKGGKIINPRIVREGKNKFLVYDVNTGTAILENKGGSEQRFNLSDTEDRANLAKAKAETLTGKDEGTDATIESLPQAIKLRTDTQGVFGFYSLENRETGITGQSKYASAILSPGWKSWWSKNKEKYKNLQSLNRQQQIQRSESILKDFNESTSENPLLK